MVKLRAIAFALVALAPALAAACPNCVAGSDKLASVRPLLAIMIALPFAVAAAIFLAIRRAQRLMQPPPPVEKSSGGTVASDGSPVSPD